MSDTGNTTTGAPPADVDTSVDSGATDPEASVSDSGLDGPFDEARARAKIKKTNAEAKALRDRLAAAETRLSEIDEAGKSELQKAVDRAAQLEAAAAEAEAGRLRLQVALEAGIPQGLASRLQGSTLEELQADAAVLMESVKPAAGAAGVAGRPVGERPASGDPTSELVEMDPAKLAAGVRRNGLF